MNMGIKLVEVIHLKDFEAWGVGRENLNIIIEKDKLSEAEEYIINQMEFEEMNGTSKEGLNDFLIYEMDDFIN